MSIPGSALISNATNPGGFTKTGSGTLTLTGSNSYAGTTVITAGTLQLGNGSSGQDGSLSSAGGISDNASLVYNLYGSQTYAGMINGSGSVTKTGSGMLTFTSANTYTGTTIVNAGTLRLGDGVAAIGSVAGNISDNAALVFANPSNQTYSGTISGTGSLTANGTGTLTLSAANSYTDGTSINAGTLSLGSAGALPPSGNITFGGGVLQFTTSNTADYSGRITASTVAVAIDTNGQNVTFAHSLAATNTGGLFKTGTGTLTLTAANSYAGSTTVNAGTLQIGVPNALPLTTLLTFSATSSSATVDLAGNNQTVGGLATVDAAAVVGNSGSTPATLNVAGTGNSTFGGTIQDSLGSGTSTTALAVSNGTLTLTGTNNSYTGGTSIKNGRLVVGISNALPMATVLTFGDTVSSSGTLDLDGNSQQVGGLAVAGSALATSQVIGNSGTSPSILTFAGSGTPSSFGGTIQDSLDGGTNTTALTVSSGTLTLTGSNFYTGGTSVSGGLLEIGGAGGLPSGTSLTIGSDGGVVFDAGIGSSTGSGDSILALSTGKASGTLGTTAGSPSSAAPLAAPLAVSRASGDTGAAAVPEPGTLGLLAAGLVGLAVAALRRRSGTGN
jgi:autotransporter-associated beta strand protein